MRILLVEDDHKISGAIKKGLEQESYAIDVVADGSKGLRQAQNITYDLIILDRMLPGLDGIEICRTLRDDSNAVPVLMLTAKDRVQDRVEGLNAGADDYLVKPFAFEELLARVRALLRRPHETKNIVYEVDDLLLDSVTMEIHRSGKNITLSSTEYALLEYLMRNADRILTKDNIISHVWDYDADILPNTVEVYIGYLRNKIDRAFPDRPALIQTIRGFGYKIGLKKWTFGRPISNWR